MSGQNRSTAVMQRRRPAGAPIPTNLARPARKALDHFPTPPFATRAMLEVLAAEIGPLDGLTAWDPCCAEGHMVKVLLEAFGSVRASDVYAYPWCGDAAPHTNPAASPQEPWHELLDFALAGWRESQLDVIVMNPPFRLAFDFIETGLKLGRRATAVLVRSAFLESEARYKRLWSKRPPAFVLQFSERVVMLEGRLVRRGSIDPFTGRKATSATAYSWLVWIAGDERETRMRWLAPSMVRLERPGDYPDYSAAERGPLPLLAAA